MKTLFISGGSRGIGRATVKYFLSKSWQVITTSTSGRLDYVDTDLTCIKFDLGDKNSLENLIATLRDSSVKIDCLINNAWWSTGRTQEQDIDIHRLQEVLSVNLVGTINLTQRLLSTLKDDSIIINISSEYGSLTEDWGFVSPSYRIAKAGINMFTRNLYKHESLVKRKIKVYSFDPGWVKTDMGGPEAPRDPSEPAKELFDLANSNLASGEFYRGLVKRDW
ncbi:MAG: SDR family NAD(P)-dependent oxidoreductase [Microgenomates group bacterium]